MCIDLLFIGVTLLESVYTLESTIKSVYALESTIKSVYAMKSTIKNEPLCLLEWC